MGKTIWVAFALFSFVRQLTAVTSRQRTAVTLLLGSPQRPDAGARLHWTGKQLAIEVTLATYCSGLFCLAQMP